MEEKNSWKMVAVWCKVNGRKIQKDKKIEMIKDLKISTNIYQIIIIHIPLIPNYSIVYNNKSLKMKFPASTNNSVSSSS